MVEGLVFYSPSGDKIREKFQWNDDQTELIKVGEEDIQKVMNERAKGLTIPEQVARIARGELGVVMDGDGFYGDVSDMSEQTVGQQLSVMEEKTAAAYAGIQAKKEAAQKSDLAKAEEALAKAQAELDALKGESK